MQQQGGFIPCTSSFSIQVVICSLRPVDFSHLHITYQSDHLLLLTYKKAPRCLKFDLVPWVAFRFSLAATLPGSPSTSAVRESAYLVQKRAIAETHEGGSFLQRSSRSLSNNYWRPLLPALLAPFNPGAAPPPILLLFLTSTLLDTIPTKIWI